jgi:hypothetical protein
MIDPMQLMTTDQTEKNMRKNRTPQPLKPTKTKAGGYLVIRTCDNKDWAVIGHKCAAPVSGRMSKIEALHYALDNPSIWMYD